MFLKKGKKQPVFLTELLCKTNCWADLNHRPSRYHRDALTEVSPVYGTFLGLGLVYFIKKKSDRRQTTMYSNLTGSEVTLV